MNQMVDEWGVQCLDVRFLPKTIGDSLLISNEAVISKMGNLNNLRLLISNNPRAGTIRGMHFQDIVSEEWKLVFPVSGSIFDVVVNVDKNSNHFGKLKTYELSNVKNKCLLIPPGYAHGYQTLTSHTTVLYLISGHYSSESAHELNPLDPDLRIPWPIQSQTNFDHKENIKYLYEF